MRADWSFDKTNALSTFFAAHQKFAQKLRTVDETAPHVIDLLDPVTFVAARVSSSVGSTATAAARARQPLRVFAFPL